MRLYDYAASANCYKVRLLLAQLELPYERVPVDIFAGDTLTDDFARLNPVRSTPVLVPETGPPLPESNAILLHLAEGTMLLPPEPVQRAQVYRWLFFEQADVIPAIAGLRFRLMTGRLAPDAPAPAPAVTPAKSCSDSSTSTWPSGASSWTPAIRLRTSVFTPTCTWRVTPASSYHPRCARGSSACRPSPGS